MPQRHDQGDKEMDGTVIRSFKRSKLRLSILRTLFDAYPCESYLSDIARRVLTDPSSASLAIRGGRIRYSRDLSLLGLGLVEERKTHGGVYYSICPDRMVDVNEILLVARSFSTRVKNVEVMIE